MKYTAVFLSILTFGLFSCNKAGLDGKATLVVTPVHHNIHAVSLASYRDSVYMFFNTKDLPAGSLSNADAIFTGEPGNDYVRCENLHAGNYFLFVAAWDTLNNARVTGGMAVTIKFKERKQEINIEVPVIE